MGSFSVGRTRMKNWNAFFIKMARLYATQSRCERLQVGAVIVRDRRVLSGGFNEAPSGFDHCKGESICNPNRTGCQRTIHAEENAIINAARHGISIQHGIMYCTHLPCPSCFGKIINSGISMVFYAEEYRRSEAIIMGRKAGVSVIKLEVK